MRPFELRPPAPDTSVQYPNVISATFCIFALSADGSLREYVYYITQMGICLSPPIVNLLHDVVE